MQSICLYKSFSGTGTQWDEKGNHEPESKQWDKKVDHGGPKSEQWDKNLDKELVVTQVHVNQQEQDQEEQEQEQRVNPATAPRKAEGEESYYHRKSHSICQKDVGQPLATATTKLGGKRPEEGGEKTDTTNKTMKSV